MALGHWILRLSLLFNVTLVISILSIWDPTALQMAASRIFFWEGDPTLALWSFYGLVIGLATLVYILSVRSIGRAVLYK